VSHILYYHDIYADKDVTHYYYLASVMNVRVEEAYVQAQLRLAELDLLLALMC